MRVSKYLVSGGIAFVMDYGILAICVELIKLGTGVSAAIGMTAGILTSFLLC